MQQMRPPISPQVHSSISSQHCLILQNRFSLPLIPKSFSFYFINSKRRFLVYFKHLQELEETRSILSNQRVKNYKRKSIFMDREEMEEIVFHGNYKYKKRDVRRFLRPTTMLRQPRTYYNGESYAAPQPYLPKARVLSPIKQQYDRSQTKQQYGRSQIKQQYGRSQKQKQKVYQTQQKQFGSHLKQQFGSHLKQQFAQPPKQQFVQPSKQQSIPISQLQTSPEYVADWGEIKIRNQQALDIILNVQLIKRLFKNQQK